MKKKKLYIAAVVLSAALAAAACAKKSEPADVTTETEQTTEAPGETETAPAEAGSETERETEAEAESENYHMLQGTIEKAASDGSAFTLQADDGSDYDITLSEIRDVETELAEGAQIAIAYIGEQLSETGAAGLESVTLVVALPEQEEWTIEVEKGTTTANAMSSFSIDTEDGRSLSFIKDNCPIEEGALSADSGDSVEVAYVSSQGMNFPIEIKAAR